MKELGKKINPSKITGSLTPLKWELPRAFLPGAWNHADFWVAWRCIFAVTSCPVPTGFQNSGCRLFYVLTQSQSCHQRH